MAVARKGSALITLTGTSFTFRGQCSDCTGTGVGVLTLVNYTQGNPIQPVNFGGFTYTSNLTNFTIAASDQTASITGTMPASLPSAATIQIFSNGVPQFESFSGGGWCSGWNCAADSGTGGTWSLTTFITPPATVPTVSLPVLGGLALLMGLMGWTILKRRPGYRKA